MHERRGLQRPAPTFGLSLNPETHFLDRVQVAVNEPHRHIHVPRDLSPILIVSVQLVAHPQGRPFRVGSRPETKGDVPRRRGQAQLFAGLQGNGLAVDAQGADFKKRIGSAAFRALDRETPT